MMILPVGLPGSGKTTVERKFAREQNALCLTPDERIIPLFGEPEADGKRPSIGNRQLRQRWLSACRYVSAEDPNGLRDFSPNEGSECEIPAEGLASVELRTTRLRLRDFELGDYQAVHAFATDLAIVSYVEWGPNTPEETQAFLREARASADVSPRRRYAFAVVHSDAERLIGSIELRVVSFEHRRGEIGCVLAHEWWGLVMQPRPLAGCSPLVSTSLACTRSPLPVIPRIGLQSRS
jgi:hypothetical protein